MISVFFVVVPRTWRLLSLWQTDCVLMQCRCRSPTAGLRSTDRCAKVQRGCCYLLSPQPTLGHRELRRSAIIYRPRSIYLFDSICLFVCLFVCLSICLSICLRCVSICLSIYCIYLSIYLSIYLCMYLFIYSFIYLSIYLSIHPSIHPSIYPSNLSIESIHRIYL